MASYIPRRQKQNTRPPIPDLQMLPHDTLGNRVKNRIASLHTTQSSKTSQPVIPDRPPLLSKQSLLSAPQNNAFRNQSHTQQSQYYLPKQGHSRHNTFSIRNSEPISLDSSSNNSAFLGDLSQSFHARQSEQIGLDSSTSLINLKIDLKRTKSVRFDETPNDKPMKDPSLYSDRNNKQVGLSSPSSRVIVPILKNSSDRSSRMSSPMSSSIGFGGAMTDSFTSHAGSEKCKLSPIHSILDKSGLDNPEKNKYEKMKQTAIKTKTKFTDSLFPPGASSTYFQAKDKKFGQNLKWVRVSQLMAEEKSYKKVLYTTESKDKSLIVSGQVNVPYMVAGLSSIKHSNRTLERIFEDQTYTEWGIYSLRLFVEGVWRYTVIDDYIPVVPNPSAPNKLRPVFLNVLPHTDSKVIEVWPLLLQKAYAKIYSTYESLLLHGNIEDFMHQVSGAVIERINTQDKQADYDLRRHLKIDSQSLVLVQPAATKNQQVKKPFARTSFQQENAKNTTPAIKQDTFYPVTVAETTEDIENRSLSFLTAEPSVQVEMVSQNGTKPRIQTMGLSDISQKYSEVLICKLNEAHYSVGCLIKQGTKDCMSIRTFSVSSTTSCDISVIQKDKRYFRNNPYSYSWARLIIAMKEKDGIRWINGGYSNRKALHLTCILDPGEYYVLVMMEWTNRIYDLHLSYNGTSPINFDRKTHAEMPNILTDTCLDLAQRFGEMKQLSPNLCSYRYVDMKHGFVIQNINNQNSRKEVAIIKSYEQAMRGAGAHLTALNKDFTENKYVVTSRIKPKDHYTLVLKVKRGEDLKMIEFFMFDE